MPAVSSAPPDPARRPGAAGRPAAAAAGLRRLGRFELIQLVAKSSRTMLWRAHDPALGAAVYLTLPRRQPADETAMAAWLRRAQHAAKVVHPQLVAVGAVGVEDRWPFIAHLATAGVPLFEHLAGTEPPAAPQSAQWLSDLLHGLAYLHEAGLAHGDVGPYSVLIDAQGRALLMAAGAAVAEAEAADPSVPASAAPAADADQLRHQRAASGRDLLACGLLLHRLLAGRPALDEADPPTAVERLDREIVRLGWTTPQPVPESLRAIVNRGTEREPQRRYIHARSLQRALQGWLDAQAAGGDGVLALLLDRLHSVGHLPALPGLVQRVAAIASMERQPLDTMTELILEDPALAFELLRQVNAAQFAAQTDNGVWSVRRAVQLVGVQGLKRTAAGLRDWPSTLDAKGAAALAHSLHGAQMAAHVARILCPADMSGDEAFIVALLQQLGELLARYHFPDEAAQIEQLVDPGPGGPRGMAPTAAAAAVIGVELEALGSAVARHWGLNETALQAMRHVSTEATVRAPDDRSDTLRLLAGVACEAVAALQSRESRAGGAAVATAAVAKVAQRYARALMLAPGELLAAVQRAERLARRGPIEAATPVLAPEPAADAGAPPAVDDTARQTLPSRDLPTLRQVVAARSA